MLKKTNIKDIPDNAFKLIGDDWMLITAGDSVSYNTMTASWGGVGVLWNKQVVFCFIRKQRHTYKFVEENEFFTLSFFDNKYKKMLKFCGTKSGKDVDKAKETGLIPIETENKSVYFEQARLVLECRKLYSDDIKSANILAPEIEKHYSANDYHRMYVGEVTNCLM